MTYSIGEVSKKIGVSISALRYYDKQGLLKFLKRTDGNIRVFDDEDLKMLNLMQCLKSTGMQISDIKQFFEWCNQGDSTIEKRYNMFLERKKETENQIEILKKTLDIIEFKCEYYKQALEIGTTEGL